ncbi:MAG: glycosyltransferase family protein [Planctomycetota bacterium]|jgi:hypothetical protein
MSDIILGGSDGLTLDQATAQLRRLYESQRRYRFIEQAHRVLSATSTAPELAQLTLRALVELGFGGPARELLQLRGDVCSDERQRIELQSSVASLPNGRVAWSSCADTFRQNVSPLLSCRPQLGECVAKLPELLSRVHLYRSVQGTYALSCRQAGQLRQWLGDLSMLEDEANVRLPPRGQLAATVVVGLRVGAVLERIYRDTHRLFLSYSPPLCLIEPDPVRFAAWLHCADHRTLLTDDRVYVFVGDQAVDQLGRLLAENPRLALPGLFVNLSPDTPVAARARETVEQVRARRERQFEEVLEALQERYRHRDAAYWMDRFAPPGPVLGVTSRFTTMLQYSTRDALSALEGQGYTTEVLLESKDHEVIPPVEICRKILELDPIMLLFLDHLRYEYPFVPRNLPFLGWIQDPLPNLLCRKAGESIGPLDLVCGYYLPRCAEEFGYPPDRLANAAIPVSTRVFHDGDFAPEEKQRYACDVCFVSHASQPIEAIYQSALTKYPATLRPLLDAVYVEVLRLIDRDGSLEVQTTAADFLRSIIAETGVKLTAEQFEHIKTYYAHRLFDWGRRQQTLEWVATWARRRGRVFKIYGRGWEQHPSVAEFAVGPIEHGEPLRRAYRASKLALQLIPSGFIHQRSFELLASGTLPVCRYCPNDFAGLPIEEFIRRREAGETLRGAATIMPGLQRVVFRSAEDFEALADRFLTEETYRHHVRTELREVVLRDYTYDAQMEKLMTAFRAQIAREAEQCTGVPV